MVGVHSSGPCADDPKGLFADDPCAGRKGGGIGEYAVNGLTHKGLPITCSCYALRCTSR